MKGKRRLCLALSAWLLFGFGCAPGLAEEGSEQETANITAPEAQIGTMSEEESPSGIRVEERGLALGKSEVYYPAVTGLADGELEKTINDRILEETRVADYLTRMSQLISGGELRVNWQGSLMEDVFSCAVFAEGAVTTTRRDFVWTWCNVDLRDGHVIRWEELFREPDAAGERIETLLAEEVAPELSAYLLNGNVLPMPEGFWLTRRGMVLLYPRGQWTTLSDRAGDLLIGWDEISEFLDLSENGIANRIGVGEMLSLTEERLPQLQRITQEGRIPDLPVKLGDSLGDAVDAWHLLTDPDLYENGRVFALEGALFRGVFLLTDNLSEGWEESRINGIRMDRGCLFGLAIGKTEATAWHQVLGEPDTTVSFDAEKAEAYRTVPGMRDYYAWGDHVLQLHSDENGTLVSIILTE